MIATDGYTGPLTPWLQRRVIPIGSYVIATEPMPEGVVAKLIPRNRIVSDTRKVVFYYRASADRRRILFGGRASLTETDPTISGPMLHADLVKIFPGLAGEWRHREECIRINYAQDPSRVRAGILAIARRSPASAGLGTAARRRRYAQLPEGRLEARVVTHEIERRVVEFPDHVPVALPNSGFPMGDAP